MNNGRFDFTLSDEDEDLNGPVEGEHISVRYNCHPTYKVKEIVRAGNARKITIRNDAGKSLLEIPLSFGVLGVVLAPVWIAIGTIAALAGHYTIVVEKRN